MLTKKVYFKHKLLLVKAKNIIKSLNEVEIALCENTSRLRVFIPRTSARSVGMSVPQTARAGVGRFHSSIHKWGLAPLPHCECGASQQTADHVLIACSIYQAPHGARGLTVFE